MSTETFFQQLLGQTKEEFVYSSIYKKQIRLGEKWNYSVCGTPIQPGKGILLGINWGADGNHDAQATMPDGKDIASYNFIKRSKYYLETYLHLNPDTINFNYANLCFFRSPREKDLTNEDYILSLPLFKQYVEFIKPPWIFSLAAGNSNRLGSLHVSDNGRAYPDKECKFKGLSGTLWDVPFFSVPHPNARVKKISRDEIWESVGKQFELCLISSESLKVSLIK